MRQRFRLPAPVVRINIHGDDAARERAPGNRHFNTPDDERAKMRLIHICRDNLSSRRNRVTAVLCKSVRRNWVAVYIYDVICAAAHIGDFQSARRVRDEDASDTMHVAHDSECSASVKLSNRRN